MNNSGDAAEQVVRLSLEGAELAAKITGAGAKELAVLLYAILKDQTKTKGKTRLTSLLKSGKELKVFAVRNQDVEKFCHAAKQYGVLYCVLREKNVKDGVTDVMVRSEDASKVNRIFERFNLLTVDRAELRSEIAQGEPVVDEEKSLVDEMLSPAPAQEEQENPIMGRIEVSRNPSAPSSEKITDIPDYRYTDDTRPSVRLQLRELELEKRRKQPDAEKKRRRNIIHIFGRKERNHELR